MNLAKCRINEHGLFGILEDITLPETLHAPPVDTVATSTFDTRNVLHCMPCTSTHIMIVLIGL
jgi:hypothetical protein